MGRPKKITDDEIMQYVREIVQQDPNMKLTVPGIGNYIRTKRPDISDVLIRRSKSVRKFIEDYNQSNSAERFSKLSTFKAIDADAFLKKNPTREKLKKALTERDNYYATIAKHAAIVFDENKKLVSANEKLKQDIRIVNEKLSKAEIKAEKKQDNEKKEIIRELKGIIDDYVNPDIANALLEKTGFMDRIDTILIDGIIDENIIDANSNLSRFKNSLVADIANDLERR